ncbi:hypothetical protein EFE38_24780 [Escherichia coli O157:H7]|nr:hypothetical protein EFE38_24780 [Escherichia coli O157:H7]
MAGPVCARDEWFSAYALAGVLTAVCRLSPGYSPAVTGQQGEKRMMC